ncbi:MAG: tripartite tricarboxylate transporter TctB family protein [Burkholderiales bacterium]|nr:tripartite tricarboxylate transporter TctB family protein [Burkholderiales bacterium]
MADRWLAGFVLALSAVYLVATSRLPSLDIGDPLGPKAFPFLVGGLGCVTALWLIVETLRKRPADATPGLAQPPAQHHALAVIAVMVWMFVFYFLIERLGFLLSCAIFLAGLTGYFNRGRWIMNAVVYLGFPVGVYLAFTEILGISLPRGVLPF